MAELSEAAKALDVLGKYGEVIVSAYLKNGCRIPESELSGQAASNLINYRLAWRHDDDDCLQLSMTVVHLLDHVTRSTRRGNGNEIVEHAYQQITRAAQAHPEVIRTGSPEDVASAERHLQEQAAILAEAITESCAHYTRMVSNGFSAIESPELRYAQIVKANGAGAGLAKMLGAFDLEEMHKIAGHNPVFRRTLNRLIPRALSNGLDELQHALSRMRDLMLAIRSELRLTNLINAFVDRFAADPTYTPTLSCTSQLPLTLHLAEPIKGSPFPGVFGDSVLDEGKLAELAKQIRLTPDIPKQRPLVEIQDAINEPERDVAPISYQMVDRLFREASKTGLPVSAREAFLRMGVPERPHYWLTCIEQYANTENCRQLVAVTAITEEDPFFTGNHVIYDVVITAHLKKASPPIAQAKHG